VWIDDVLYTIGVKQGIITSEIDFRSSVGNVTDTN